MKIFSVRQSYWELELAKLGETLYIFNFHKNVTPKRADKLIEAVYKRKPDIFIMHKDPLVTPVLLSKIKNASPKTKIVCWIGDQRGGVHELAQQRIGYLDLLLVNNDDAAQFQQYRRAGIRNIKPFYDGIWEKEFFPIDQDREFDILFGGNNFKAPGFPLSLLRNQLVNTLKSKFNMVVHGNGWGFPTKKVVRRSLYNLELNKARMSLGINHYDIVKYYEERFWECIGSGRMHLTYYIPGMEQDFKNHKHLVWFKSIDECCDLVKYYLKRPGTCNEIGANGRALLVKNHTHMHRAMQLRKYFKSMF